MRKFEFITVLLNTIAICLLIMVMVFSENNRTVVLKDGSIIHQSISLNMILVLPIIMLIINSVDILRRSSKNDLK